MTISLPELEGVIVLVIDDPEGAHRLERALGNAGAAVFVAHDDQGCRDVLGRVQPHFAVVDPSSTENIGRRELAWRLFSHPDIRVVLYSSNVQAGPGAAATWLVDKSRPVSDVIDVIFGMVEDPNWPVKSDDKVKPKLRDVNARE
jgi:hypothetical protein